MNESLLLLLWEFRWQTLKCYYRAVQWAMEMNAKGQRKRVDFYGQSVSKKGFKMNRKIWAKGSWKVLTRQFATIWMIHLENMPHHARFEISKQYKVTKSAVLKFNLTVSNNWYTSKVRFLEILINPEKQNFFLFCNLWWKTFKFQTLRFESLNYFELIS